MGTRSGPDATMVAHPDTSKATTPTAAMLFCTAFLLDGCGDQTPPLYAARWAGSCSVARHLPRPRGVRSRKKCLTLVFCQQTIQIPQTPESGVGRKSHPENRDSQRETM